MVFWVFSQLKRGVKLCLPNETRASGRHSTMQVMPIVLYKWTFDKVLLLPLRRAEPLINFKGGFHSLETKPWLPSRTKIWTKELLCLSLFLSEGSGGKPSQFSFPRQRYLASSWYGKHCDRWHERKREESRRQVKKERETGRLIQMAVTGIRCERVRV